MDIYKCQQTLERYLVYKKRIFILNNAMCEIEIEVYVLLSSSLASWKNSPTTWGLLVPLEKIIFENF